MSFTKSHSCMINNRKEQNYQFWKLKELNGDPKVTFSVRKKCHQHEPSSGKCYLCLNENLYILKYKDDNLLNQRRELVSKCRHKNKYKLCKHKLRKLRHSILHCIGKLLHCKFLCVYYIIYIYLLTFLSTS